VTFGKKLVCKLKHKCVVIGLGDIGVEIETIFFVILAKRINSRPYFEDAF